MFNEKKIKLGSVLEFKNGKKIKKDIEGYPIYGGNGILGYSNKSNSENSIIIGRVGAYCGSVFYEKHKCWVSDNAIISYPKNSSNIKYYFYLLKSLNLNKRQIGSGQPLITQNILKEIKIYLPPLHAQKKIASILSALDDKIELNNKINKNLEEMAQAIFKSWFVDFEPWGGEMPDDWEYGTLKNILNLKKESITQNNKKELPYLPIEAIPKKSFAIKEFKSNQEAKSSLIKFKYKDIIIGAMRVYFHRVILAPCDGITRTTCFVLRPISQKYLYYGLLVCNQKTSIDYANSTSKGSTMPYAIWDGGLGELAICIPPTKILNKFNELIEPMISKIQNSYSENKNLTKLRDTLLPKLMSGELDVSDLDI